MLLKAVFNLQKNTMESIQFITNFRDGPTSNASIIPTWLLTL